VSPFEFERRYYDSFIESDKAAWLKQSSLRYSRGGSKPYFFSRLNETSYYFIYTTDPELQVWHYCDGDDTFECTGFSFIDYLKSYLSGIKCSKGIWLNETIPDSV
jgi:hypothetical protein